MRTEWEKHQAWAKRFITKVQLERKRKKKMRFNIPAKARIAIYIVTALGAPVMAYLFAKGYVGELEVGLFSALVTAVNGMAALNVNEPQV